MQCRCAKSCLRHLFSSVPVSNFLTSLWFRTHPFLSYPFNLLPRAVFPYLVTVTTLILPSPLRSPYNLLFPRVVSSCPESCIAVYQPVCGTDGHTYSSECHLAMERCNNPCVELKHEGECGESERLYSVKRINCGWFAEFFFYGHQLSGCTLCFKFPTFEASMGVTILNYTPHCLVLYVFVKGC